jgi:uncharacterized protein YbaA (DUF1428 family)
VHRRRREAGQGHVVPQSVKLKKNEAVWFSWIVYKSKADRNRILKLAMADKRLASMMDPKAMPFDMQRMIYGGFKVMVNLQGEMT